MNISQPLLFQDFGAPDSAINEIISVQKELHELSSQALYIKRYLRHLGAVRVILEQNYFDRDYLEEFANFYSKSSRGYPNSCKRAHFFKDEYVTRELFTQALKGDEASISLLNQSYLGFTVIRPIPQAPFGRTVLSWYPDTITPPRVVEPARVYKSHIANLTFEVLGLAWQQQDSAIAACATVGLWSMLHSSAFTEFHSIPTTAQITEAANSIESTGINAFPSRGLTEIQILQAIKKLGLSPTFVRGTLPNNWFSKKHFASVCAAFIRSGYPLLIVGNYKNSYHIGHAVCAVGFRDATFPEGEKAPELYRQDEYIEVLYIHDDNVGPNVRMVIDSEIIPNDFGLDKEACVIKMSGPEYVELDEDEPTIDNNEFIPSLIIAAVHKDLRICPVQLMATGLEKAQLVNKVLNNVRQANNLGSISTLYSTRFVQVVDYLDKELEIVLGNGEELLGQVRFNLLEQLPPMSLHLAILRIASTDNTFVLLDLIYDTTDADRNRPVFGHVVYDEQVAFILTLIKRHMGDNWFDKHFGKTIKGY